MTRFPHSDGTWYIANVAPLESWARAVEGRQALDNRIIGYLGDARDELAARTLALSPERAAILRGAFDLHWAENYIASIPLILTQVDGICAQQTLPNDLCISLSNQPISPTQDFLDKCFMNDSNAKAL